jgi:hypothetical protein
MPTEIPPSVESWYQDAETGRSFRVVAVDEPNETIDVQFYNGDIGELDFASWQESTILPIEPPEDASAPFDDVEAEDLGYTDLDLHERGNLTLDDLLDERDAY